MSTNRAAAIPLHLGVVAGAVVALPYKLFELDRYFVPKELVLHSAALLLIVVLLARGRRMKLDAADLLLAAFLGWSALSAVFATNYWLAQRALGLSFSSAVVFWTARHLGAAGIARSFVVAGAFAGVVSATTVLAQAYGFESPYFSLNRAPGGTFGNRNFAAHFAAIALPALVYSAVTARRSAGALAGAIGMALISAALVLTRSRAAWLAVATTAVTAALFFLVSRRYWKGGRVGPRLAQLALAAFLGASAAIVLPNDLNWRSDSPYLDSARGMVDYRSGSGRGRVAQYQNSLELVKADPLFGVGPGNWPVRYPAVAPGGDKSLADDGMTANPWPSSDWVATVSERGVIAALALLGVFAALFITSLRRWSELQTAEHVLLKMVLGTTITAAMVVSAFDAVLLLGAPALLVWTIIGATSGVARSGREVTLSRRSWLPAAALLVVVVGASLVRSTAQMIAITAVGSGGTRAGWAAAAPWDPGSYRIHQRVAELHAARGRCRAALPHARRARDLFPDAAAPRRIIRRCS